MPGSAIKKAALQRSIATIEARRVYRMDEAARACIGFGVAEVDRRLGGGLARGDLHEFRCEAAREVACLHGLVFALLCREGGGRPVVWLRDASTIVDGGRIDPDGLSGFGFAAARILHVRTLHIRDALWAAGEAIKEAGLAAVILHIRGNPQAYDLSVSRKLMMRARESGVPFFLLRHSGQAQASSAATRWRVRPAASVPHGLFSRSVGPMQLVVMLERNRNGRTGEWRVAWNPKNGTLEHVKHEVASTHPGLPAAASAHRPDRETALGRVMALERAS